MPKNHDKLQELQQKKAELRNAKRDPINKEENGIEDKRITSFEEIGKVSKKGDIILLTVNTDRGEIEITINNYTPDDSVAEVIQTKDGKRGSIQNKNWLHIKNTPKAILEALNNDGFRLKKETTDSGQNKNEQGKNQGNFDDTKKAKEEKGIAEKTNESLTIEEILNWSQEDLNKNLTDKEKKLVLQFTSVNLNDWEETKENYAPSAEFVAKNIIDIRKRKEKPLNNTKEIKKEGTIEEIAELLKNNKIDQIIVAGEKKPDLKALEKDPKSKEKIFTLRPDLDASTALYILNNFNKKSLEETYNNGAVTSVVEKNGAGKELVEEKSGLKIFLDTGGEWIKIEKNGETTTLYIDHHGAGQREHTSGAKMMLEIMEKADILTEKPEWLTRFVSFVNDVDNLSYLEKTNDKGEKIFNESYFKNEWPDSLYALAEKQIPFDKLISLCGSGIIKDPSVPFTTEELNGDIGKIKIGELTIKELCNEQRKIVMDVMDNGVKNRKKHNKQQGLNTDSKIIGKIIYQNYEKDHGQVDRIPDHLAFKATKASGFDTYISWNKRKEGGSFFINSLNPNLSKIVEELNREDPDCAVDVRGVMVFGKIKNLTEKQFLDIIDPEIARSSKLENKKVLEKNVGKKKKQKKIDAILEQIAKKQKENQELKEILEKLDTYIENYKEDKKNYTETEELTEEEIKKYKEKSKKINLLNNQK